jgi:hypothetical protein
MPIRAAFGSNSERLRERYGKCELDDFCMRLAVLPYPSLAVGQCHSLRLTATGAAFISPLTGDLFLVENIDEMS